MQITNGKYIGAVKAITVSNTERGATMVNFTFDLLSPGMEGQTIRANQCIVQKDGKINKHTYDMLQDVFGWTGLDPSWMVDEHEKGTFDGLIVQLMVENETYTAQDGSSKTSPRVQWINKSGGGSQLPENADRNEIMSKYGASFRAMAESKLQNSMPPSQPAPASSAPPAPQSNSPACTKQEAWDEFNACRPGVASHDVQQAWFTGLNKLFPGRDHASITPAEWGQLKAELCDDVPY
tara:strand:- start:140 stop:850 length:711 start_codon:yes stop_codon:yes gene_type:complete